MSVHLTDMGCDVHTKERLVKRRHKAGLASLLDIGSGQSSAGHGPSCFVQTLL